MRLNKSPLAPVQGIVRFHDARSKEFIDSEIIKEKLEALDAKLDKIIGYLEALQASRGTQ